MSTAQPYQLNQSLVAVVVTHNRLDALKKTVARLCEVEEQHLAHIVVVDNCSNDGTGGWLAQQVHGRIEVLTQATNIGGAGGFEVGMRHAVATYDPDWIVVMDDDARPVVGALERFISQPRAQADGWAAAVFQSVDQGAMICDANIPWVNPFWHRDVFWRTMRGMLRGRARTVFHLSPEDYAAEAPRRIDGSSFVGFFISRDGIARVGYPDGSLFIYGDDVLYTLGLTAKGGQILFDPTVRFDHDYTTQAVGDQRICPLWKCYYRYRNQMIVYRLCTGGWFVLVGPMMALKWVVSSWRYSGERRTYLALVARAVRDGVLRRTDVALATVRQWTGGQ